MKKLLYSLFFICIILGASCSLPTNETTDSSEQLDLSDWTEETHGSNVPPNYDAVFTDNEVKRIDLVIDPDDWQAMLDDMTSKYGNFGTGGRMNPDDMRTENPIFVPCSFYFEDRQWYKVGVRFKGHSSLMTAWSRGIWKISLKLDFDQFEDDYPEILDQRFFGFRQLSLGSNFSDPSLLREKVVPEIFREMGVHAPHTAFCRVYIDHGDGPLYFGLYTIVEMVDDTMLKDQFGSDNGNCYKPEGTGASFAAGTFNEIYFDKKTNITEGDWSDIIALFDVLHSSTRTSQPEQWRSQLENVFYVHGFMKWLAVNTVIQNWDTYGNMTHNYYLYNDPNGNGLSWIPWDNNMALQDMAMRGGMRGALPIALDEVGNNWPLIRFLMDQPIYRELYISHVEETINGAFNPEKMVARYQELHHLIQPYVTGAEGEVSGYTWLNFSSEFDSALQELIQHVHNRKTNVENYLNQQ